MKDLFLGLGSNIRPQHFLPIGLRELTELLGPLARSAVYEGAAIGFSGDPFWNLVVRAETAFGVGELQARLRDIEFRHGRPADATRFSARTLDIDILVLGKLTGVIDGIRLPRPEITENAFVLRPLAELAGESLHPELARSYAELWSDYDQAAQPLRQVSL
ncbi:MAG: 2-amino-4-hydroxy-6-hydroxymethyldihydropteridine diphosphokinase [Pseudomonadota bacterium]